MRRGKGVFACAAIWATVGCGPSGYISNVTRASRSLERARQVNADERAPYEMTAAREYLHKARELGGYARYQDAVRFARRATQLADAAQTLAAAPASAPRGDAEAGAPASTGAPPPSPRGGTP